MSPRIAVVVPLPVHPDRALAMLQAVAGLAATPEHDVILVDTSAGALDALLARAVGDVEVLRPAGAPGPAEALILAAQRAGAEILAVLAPDARPTEGWLAGLAEALDDPAVVAATSGAADGTPGIHGLAARRAHLPRAASSDDLRDLALDLAGRGPVRRARASTVAVDASPIAERVFGATPELSIVIPTLAPRSERVQRCLRAIEATVEVPHEVLLMHNGAAPQGFAGPVNAGLRAARGSYMVVMNDDVEPLAHWWPPLRRVLDAGSAVAFPRTIESFERHDFAAWCFALTRETLDLHAAAPGEFFDPELVVHFQDSDLLMRLQAVGRPPIRVPESAIRHGLSQTLAGDDATLRAWVDEQVGRDRDAFEERHPGVLAKVRWVSPAETLDA
jgi:GT2 family glycosyltransferase